MSDVEYRVLVSHLQLWIPYLILSIFLVGVFLEDLGEDSSLSFKQKLGKFTFCTLLVTSALFGVSLGYFACQTKIAGDVNPVVYTDAEYDLSVLPLDAKDRSGFSLSSLVGSENETSTVIVDGKVSPESLTLKDVRVTSVTLINSKDGSKKVYSNARILGLSDSMLTLKVDSSTLHILVSESKLKWELSKGVLDFDKCFFLTPSIKFYNKDSIVNILEVTVYSDSFTLLF